jgi:CPA2 family monovalent cation:H+ antiporter-2
LQQNAQKTQPKLVKKTTRAANLCWKTMTPLIVFDLLIILASGFTAALFCKALKCPLLVGYIAAGALLGSGGLGLIGIQTHEIEYIAEAGALLLLFSIGLEFSLSELTRLWRNIAVGGISQMVLVSLPVACIVSALGLAWQPSLLLGLAVALSSTVLVFKTLAEYGQTVSSSGRSALSILLLQDIAIVPVLLIVPLLAGGTTGKSITDILMLTLNSACIITLIPLLRKILRLWIAPFLYRQHSPELIVLFVLSLLGILTTITYLAGLPPALGAFACGLILNGNRLTGQIDALVLPFRETFAAVFFISLGMMFNPGIIKQAPFFAGAAFIGILFIKSGAGCIAARMTGQQWRSSLGIGIGLSQIGEFSFILALAGLKAGIIMQFQYDFLLVFALASLMLSPLLLKTGIKLFQAQTSAEALSENPFGTLDLQDIHHAIIIGIGHIGKQLSLHLETRGFLVCAVDFSPVNLHPLSLQGITGIAGDARNTETLERAQIKNAQLAIVCVPDDAATVEIFKSIRACNPACTVLIRCRYRLTAEELQKLGADIIITEESATTKALVDVLAEKDML